MQEVFNVCTDMSRLVPFVTRPIRGPDPSPVLNVALVALVALAALVNRVRLPEGLSRMSPLHMALPNPQACQRPEHASAIHITVNTSLGPSTVNGHSAPSTG